MPSLTASISNYLIFIAMKTAVYILAACLMAWVAMPQQANAQTLRNSSNAVLCKISSDGTVTSPSNATLGKFASDGTIRNASNATLGKVSSDGTVRNASNATLGKISSDGTVRNASNATIGTAKGVDPEWAAAYFFFKFFK